MIIKRLLITSALTGGLLASAAGVATAATSHLVSPSAPAAAAHLMKASGNSPSAQPDPSGEATSQASGEATSHESDGPGGHQDPSGQNADHQFNGTE